MELAELQKHWDRFGKDDPLWAILTDPTKKSNRWDPAEFFHTGVLEIAEVMRYVSSLGLSPGGAATGTGPHPGRALDFGCGVGRLTQALCEHFAECDGVDIAASMIEGARRFNRFGDRCRYHVNIRDDLSLFPDASFDFIYSNIVLQHMEPRYSQAYVREFIRLLKPNGGVAVFQIPSALGGTPIANPLPRSAFRALIRPAEARLTARAGEALTVPATVHNASDVPWPAGNSPRPEYQIRLANHWLDPAGKMLVKDDARAPLPHDLPAGREVELKITVHAPRAPGSYLLQLDMVQEAVTWFSDAGSQTARIAVTVEPATTSATPAASTGAAAAPTNAPAEPEMEMHPVPRAAVEDLVRQAGARLADVQEHESAVPGFISCRYCVAK